MQKLIKLFVELREKSLLKKEDQVLAFYDNKKNNIITRVLFKNNDDLIIYETAKDTKERDKKITCLQKACDNNKIESDVATRIERDKYIVTAAITNIDPLIRILDDYVTIYYHKSVFDLIEKHYQVDPTVFPQNDLMRELQTRKPTPEQIYSASYPKLY